MLEFARELFVDVAPNTAGWCATLERFLETRKYKLTTRVCILMSFMARTDPLLRTLFGVGLQIL
jgi:hypothetical protein